ncbi:MAG: hypothetical protein HY097_07210 [Nitrospinae bacterium]|nr:hypothetical protein [Nitrospinota bacterium]MBI3815801.1 hypothetical protein [Nitrospinota bacterium]
MGLQSTDLAMPHEQKKKSKENGEDGEMEKNGKDFKKIFLSFSFSPLFPVLLIYFLIFSSNAYASSWMQTEGDSIGATGAIYSLSDSFYERDGNLVQYPTRQQQGIYYLYYEYGYSYYYTLFASTAWTYSDRGTSTDSGVDDVKIGIRGRLNPFRNGRTWQLTAILPVRKWDLSGYRPGEGKYGLEAGIFYRLLPDPYEKPFTEYPDSIWGGGLGTTLRSGGSGSEVWAYGKWEKNLFNPSWLAAINLSALSSFAGGESGSVDIYGPNDSYHYDRAASDVSLSYRLNMTTGISISYKRDLWGRNINKNESVHIGIYTTWKR